ncbi:sugar kinase [Alkalicoccus urumqiensis]|uniref:Sugar kinase n=1 Tax=Alkalicoccus urumqiensis TaxID=1548213 RepID=A0A2P6MJ45_ALKUR|nr:sugar kinase [Alkalicoccus urumqiensis]PRO66309.1 sugar kinase [Alkalicoccus urumqiensis]
MDVVTMGESMALFTPEKSGQLRYVQNYSRSFGGAESNVAAGLAKLGHQARWISRVGEDEFGEALLRFLRGEGVDTSFVERDPEAPTGIYFKEYRKAGSMSVQYYRHGSAASRMAPGIVSEKALKGASFFHMTGITPALSVSCREAVLDAVKTASRMGVRVVMDPNLRLKLWKKEEAVPVLKELLGYTDIALPGVDDGEVLFGTRDPEEIGRACLALGCHLAVVKTGAGALLVTETDVEQVEGSEVEVVDPVGAGDAFCAGFLSGLLDGMTPAEAAARGHQTASFVVQVKGDVEGLPDRRELAESDSRDVRR